MEGFTDQLYMGSLLIQIPQGQDSVVVDKAFDWGTVPTGAIVILSDCQYGDTGSMTLVHPLAGVVGDMGAVHLPSGNREINISVPGANTEVPHGLIYRFTLNAIDTNGRNAILWLLVKH